MAVISTKTAKPTSSAKFNMHSVYLTLVSIVVIAEVAAGQIIRLGELNVDPAQITLSGFSSGGTFAQQVQFSYSSLFSGIAVFSHTYYRCGPPTGVQQDYDNVCTTLGNFTNDQLWNTDIVHQDIQNYFQQGLIENPGNLRNTKLYVFAGTRNQLFTTDMSLRAVNVYERFIQNVENIKTRVMEASLLLPTEGYGIPCPQVAQRSYFIGSCGLNGAFDALSFLLGDVKKPDSLRPDTLPRLQPLLTFNQTEFFYGGNGIYNMDEFGYIYVPARCYYSKCRLHFYFHGCLTGREFNGTAHVINSGFLQVAELNNVIVVFPQAVGSPGNEIGCWDTYGVTGPLYATQAGSQVSVIRNILARILGEYPTEPRVPQALDITGPSVLPLTDTTGNGIGQAPTPYALQSPAHIVSSGGGGAETGGYQYLHRGFTPSVSYDYRTASAGSSPAVGSLDRTVYSWTGGYGTNGK